MSEMEQNMKILVLFLLFFRISFADRKVTTEFFSQQSADNKTVEIGHVTAKGTNDVIHYFFSTEGIPSVMYVRTTLTAKLNVGKDTISFDPQTAILYNYGIAFNRLIEYNDKDDKADMTHYGHSNDTWNIYNLDEFMWENMTAQSDAATNTILMNVSKTFLNDKFNTNGSITFKFESFGGSGREDQLPHLEYNENITQFDMSIDHISATFSKSRFALEVFMVGQGLATMDTDHSKSIDDEYTPGVFSIENWLTTIHTPEQTGFLQWKPVCYKSVTRARAVATGMKHYGLQQLTANQESQLSGSILQWYYGDGILGITRQAMNFSFGLSQDGGYNKTQELSWSASIGFGTPPKDTVSSLVIIIISAGLGLPVVIILLGGVYVCWKKRNSNDPKPLRSIQGGYQSLPSD